MITLANTLKVSDIRLHVASTEVNAAIVELANVLRHDRRITDWNRFVSELEKSPPCVAGDHGSRFCLPHARTDSVNTLVMAAARSGRGFKIDGEDEPCRYIFLVGIPSALAAEYLRIIGALARVLSKPETERRLAAAETEEDFHDILVEAEMAM